MSAISDSLDDATLGRIPKRVELFKLLIEAAEPLFQLEGKHLEVLHREHAQNLMNYSLAKEECKTIEDALRGRLEEIESMVYKHYNEGGNGSKALGTTDIKFYVKGDPRYVSALNAVLEVVQARRQLEAIVEAFQSMGWSLGHITKLRIAELEDVTL
jgi:hypothetical protein